MNKWFKLAVAFAAIAFLALPSAGCLRYGVGVAGPGYSNGPRATYSDVRVDSWRHGDHRDRRGGYKDDDEGDEPYCKPGTNLVGGVCRYPSSVAEKYKLKRDDVCKGRRGPVEHRLPDGKWGHFDC